MISNSLPLWLPEINLLIKSVVVLVSAALLLKFTQKVNSKINLLIWKATFVLLACLPLFYFFPLVHWEVIHATNKTSLIHSAKEDPVTIINANKDQVLPISSFPPSSTLSDINTSNLKEANPKIHWFKAFRMIWLIGIILLLGHLIIDIVVLHLIYKRGNPIIPSEWINSFSTIKKQHNISRKVRLVISPLINTPITFGLFRPVILMPNSSSKWSVERFSIVAVHELSHIKNLDYVFNLFVACTKIFFWLNPLVWWASKQFRLETEINNDALVLKNGLDPITYATHLFEIAAQSNSSNPKVSSSGLMFTKKSDLKERVKLILRTEEGDKISRSHWLIRFAWLALLFPLLAVKLDLQKKLTPPPKVSAVEPIAISSEDLTHYSNDELLKFLKDSILSRKTQAALLLGQRKEKSALPHLLKLTKAQNLEVKESAIIAIGHYQMNSNYYALERLHLHPEKKIRQATLWSLQQIGCLPAFRLISEHTAEEDLEVKLQAIDLLQSYNSKKLQDWLMGNLWNHKVENWILSHFEAIRVTGNLSILIEILVQEQPEKRHDIETALKELPNLQKLRKVL